MLGELVYFLAIIFSEMWYSDKWELTCPKLMALAPHIMAILTKLKAPNVAAATNTTVMDTTKLELQTFRAALRGSAGFRGISEKSRCGCLRGLFLIGRDVIRVDFWVTIRWSGFHGYYHAVDFPGLDRRAAIKSNGQTIVKQKHQKTP
jgi:hypothetical protein